MIFCLWRRHIWAVKNQALRPDRLVFLARGESDWENYDALEAARRLFKVVACFANSFFGCKSVLMLGDVVNTQ